MNYVLVIHPTFLVIIFGAFEFISIVYYDYAKKTFESPQIIYFVLFGIALGGSVSYIFGRI